MLKCSKCLKYKPPEEFGWSGRSMDNSRNGRAWSCKKCVGEYQQTRYALNKYEILRKARLSSRKAYWKLPPWERAAKYRTVKDNIIRKQKRQEKQAGYNRKARANLSDSYLKSLIKVTYHIDDIPESLMALQKAIVIVKRKFNLVKSKNYEIN